MTYKEYREQREKEINELPIFWAFSDQQFKEAMEERGLTENDTDQVVKCMGGLCLKKDLQIVKDFLAKPDPLKELMQDYDFAYEAILYEMNNHEYAINWQADWDVCSCFGNVKYTEAEDELEQYFDQLGWEDTTRKAYLVAKKEHYKMAEENEWF